MSGISLLPTLYPLPRWCPRARRVLACLALALPLSLSSMACGAAVPWPDVSYSYYADNTRATQVLRDFANAFGLSLDMSSDISVRASGRYNTPTPTEFLNRITGSLGLTWFVYAGTLHISRSSDVITRSLSIPNVNVSAIRQALADLGLLDARFGWGELPDQGVVLISGPPAYVELIAKTITALPTNTVAAGQQMVVYRMQHAEVNDRQIRYRDTQVTIPGVASILRNLLERSNEVGSGKSGVTVQANRPLPGPMTPLGGFGALEREGARDSTREMSATGSSSPTNESLAAPSASPRSAASATESGTRGSLRASIEAYPYLNAVVVRDYPWRFPLYEALIKQLDVPTALIEIEAVILDVKKSSIHELGVSWGGRIGGVAAGHGVLDTAPATGTISLVTGAAGAINPATIVADAGNYLSSRIKALEQSGDAHVQSSPSVLTVDNVGAVLDLSQTFYIQTVGERVANVTPVTAGTTLRVTPRLIERNGARVIQMVIDIQDGQVVSSNQSGVLPTVSNSTISTQAIVGEGESLLIGGYNTGTKSADSDRIPFLGRLPIVGALFGTTRDEVSQRERMFLIRPRLVALPGAAPPAAAKSTQPLTQPLDTQALSAPTSLPQPFPSEMLPAPLVPTAPPPSTKPASSARTIAEPINVSRLLSRNEAAIGTDVRNIEQASYTPLPPGN